MIRIHVFLADRAEDGIPYGLRFAISRMPSLLPGASTSKAIPSRLLGFMLLHLI